MKPETQLERIIAILERDGALSRNQCLSMFPAITRLGARICDLERRGWRFVASFEGEDYVYRVAARAKAVQLALV